VARIAERVALEIVLVLRLGLPEFAGWRGQDVSGIPATSRLRLGIFGVARFHRRTGSTAERIWSLINFFTAAILATILVFLGDVFVQKQLLSQVGLLAIIGARTILDYFTCWDFYFPPADRA
jgi:hypothetical protein